MRRAVRLGVRHSARHRGARHMLMVQRARTSEAWVPREDKQLAKAYVNSLKHTLSIDHSTMAEQIVPWFLGSMPRSYFDEVSEPTREQHLKGLMALKGIHGNEDIALTLTSKAVVDGIDVTEVTVMRTDARPGVLNTMLASMRPQNGEASMLHQAKAYCSMDDTLTLNIFTYGPADVEPARATLEDGRGLLQSGLGGSGAPDSHLFTEAALKEYFGLCRPSFIKTTSAPRAAIFRRLYEQVRGTESVEVRVDPGELKATWVTIAAANVIPTDYLLKATGVLGAHGVNVIRMCFDVVRDPTNYVGGMPGSVAMIRFLVNAGTRETLPGGRNPFQGSPSDLAAEPWLQLCSDLRRARWLDDITLKIALSCSDLGMVRAEILSTFCRMLHGPLSKLNPFGFTLPNMLQVAQKPAYMRYAADITDLFVARFNPNGTLSESECTARARALRERIRVIQDETARMLLTKMVDAVESTLRTNLFLPDRYALALRVRPTLMVAPSQAQPFGVFFVHGERFDGFHNRFQNIARGGLRVVTPHSKEQFGIESSRCYDEAYGLSFAQEMKNKDIPEGGSKAVVLVDTTRALPSHGDYMRRTAVKAFTNSLLDLTVPTEETRKYIVDYLGQDELIYLGPDEQVIPEDINWIVQQAGKRGYPIPAAFMSSKPLAGINHKEYGVTSEGIKVFLDVALRSSGIDPTSRPFTIKITGGPDGDVAGNLMRIMFRDYGENARVVGVADGSGCAEDPAGLSHAELMRLFEGGLPIAEYSQDALSPGGTRLDISTEEGIKMRNSMHNRLKADVFVPAGGRPSTIHADNWESFLDPATGEPSSPLIVEGANIFITPEARQFLFDRAQVKIVKDSSANKCGVITSSFEICASMLLDEAEFLAIKDELVRDVLERLRSLARCEAELMFREYHNYKGSLPHFSERISGAINRAYSALRVRLADVQRGDDIYNLLLPLFLEEHLPRKLTEVAGDRVNERIPLDYLRNAFGKMLASKLLYSEGIHFLEVQPEERIAELAFKYVKEEEHVRQIVATVSDSSLQNEAKAQVLEVLRRGGVRSRLGVY